MHDLAEAAAPAAAVEVPVEDRAAHVRFRAGDREPVAEPAERLHQRVLHEVGGIIRAAAQQERVAGQRVAALRDEVRDDTFPAVGGRGAADPPPCPERSRRLPPLAPSWRTPS